MEEALQQIVTSCRQFAYELETIEQESLGKVARLLSDSIREQGARRPYLSAFVDLDAAAADIQIVVKDGKGDIEVGDQPAGTGELSAADTLRVLKEGAIIGVTEDNREKLKDLGLDLKPDSTIIVIRPGILDLDGQADSIVATAVEEAAEAIF